MYLKIQSQRALQDSERLAEILRGIRMGCHMFEGITDATMSYNEAWHFLRLGRQLERADKTSRILDVKYFMLLPSANAVGTPYDDIHWSAVLKSVSGFEMYRKRHGRIAPRNIVEFLVLDREFPRDPFDTACARRMSPCTPLPARPWDRATYPSERTIAPLRAELDYTPVEHIINQGLHEYLDALQVRMNTIDDESGPRLLFRRTPRRACRGGRRCLMGIRVGLYHKTTYEYDRLVTLSPQTVRLRPAPHTRTPVTSFSLRIDPKEHFINWQQDPQGNFLARLVFPKETRRFSLEVDLVAEMTVINPFDFFLEPYAEKIPFQYEAWEQRELEPYRKASPPGPKLQALLSSIDRKPTPAVDFLVALNQRLQQEIHYLIRTEPGVQAPEKTLELMSGSCRDSGWLLVETLRHLGLAARFVSGYLIQLKPDVKPLEGPAGAEEDFTDLHAWAEVYLPGAGWIGLDPTSGLFAGEGHIPLAATPEPRSAAPVTGLVSPSKVEFHHEMRVRRIFEPARVTKPYTEEQWQRLDALGDRIDEELVAGDVRLTMGGEPTFVSIDDMDGEEWNTAALGPAKLKRAKELLLRLREEFGKGGLLHYGQGKWYPGEPLPRWTLTCFWRIDGVPLWNDPAWLAETDRDYGFGSNAARQFTEDLAQRLGVGSSYVIKAYEDPLAYLLKERKLPANVDPLNNKLDDPLERENLRKVFERGLGKPTGYVLPIKREETDERSQCGRVASGCFARRTSTCCRAILL